MPIIAPSYLPESLKSIWVEAYIEAGGQEGGTAASSYALEVMRGIRNPPPGFAWSQSQIRSMYDASFGGNRRDDDTFRFDELGYTQEKIGFGQIAADFGIRPDVWSSRFEELIAGDVDQNEFYGRIQSAYEDIIYQAPEIAEYYAREFGATGVTPEDILVAYLDPNTGAEIFANNASVSLVGGTGAQHGFDIAADFAEQLLYQGLNTNTANNEFFGAAQEQIPILETLAKRHNDPDDDFDLNEFSAGYLFSDPTQRRRMARLVAQESAQFSGGRVGVARDRTGSLTGLIQQ